MTFLAALLTFLAWVLAVLGGFIAGGALVGAGLSRVIPPYQQRVSRRMAFWACVWAALLAGGPAAIQVGAIEGALSLADGAALGRGRVILPRLEVASLERTARDVRHEVGLVRQEGVPRYALEAVAIQPFREVVGTVRDFVVAYRKQKRSALGTSGVRSAWGQTRGSIDALARRKVAGSILFGAAYLGGMFLFGLGLYAISRRELVRVSRAMAAHEAGSRSAPPGP